MGIVVKHVGHVVVKVSDLAPALAFYCGVLGLEEVAHAAPDIWRRDPSAVAHAVGLDL